MMENFTIVFGKNRSVYLVLFFVLMVSNFVHGQCSKYQVFESIGTTIPTSGGTWTATSVGYGTGNARTGNNQINFNATNDAIITPLISNPGVFSFWYARNSNTTAHSLDVQTATSTSGPWTSRGTTTTPTTASVYQQFSVDLGALGLTNVYVRIIDTRGSGTQNRFIDDISWTSTSASSTLLIPALSNCSQTITSGLDYTFSDEGTANDTYNLSADYTITFTPSVTGGLISLNFSAFDTESDYDGMVIYNGPTISSPIISSGLSAGINATNCPAGSFYGTTSPGSIISTDASGAITIRFRSDGSTNNLGWLAAVKCIAPIDIATSPSASICSGSSTTLTASSATAYTYTWSPATGLSGTTGASVVASPTTTTTYTVTGALGATTITKTITINVSLPTSTLTVTPASVSICQNAIQTLTASGGLTSTTAILGTGTTSTTASTTASTLGPNPLQSYYGGAKQQMLVTAAELTSLGMTNVSSISSLAFNLSAVESRVLQNYKIRMRHTTLTAFSSTTFVTSGFTVVRNSGNLTPVSGWNNIALDTPFTWNGTDNLLIEITFSNNDTGGTGTNTTLYSTTSFASTLFYRADSQTAATIEATTTASFAAYSSRNNMRFGFTIQAPVTWSPITELYTNAGATVAYTGTSALTVYSKPTISRTYTATATNGVCSTTATSAITVNALPMASISGNNGPVVCSGSDITFSLTGTSGAVVTYNLNGGATATATLTGGSATVTVSAATATQTLNLVSVTDGTCPVSLSGSSTVVIESTTWDGILWSNGTPSSTKAVSFTGNYTIGADFDACSISVSNNAVVSVTSGFNVTLNGAITVASGSSFTLNNNANLFQSNASAVNTGNIIVKRQSNPLIRLDYTMWSSPVTGQGLYAFSPFTFANRFYVYDTSSNLYNNSSIGFNVTGLNGAGVNGTDTNNVPFTTGRGYLIRLPYNHPTAPVVWNGSFTGVANNGTKTITLANVSATQQFNAVGNPYPSPIDIAQFATDNASNIESTLYFWRKTNNAASPSYCTWNTASATFGDNGEAYTNSPNGVIQTGQGFIVEAKDGATSLEFNNGQRLANNANQFFRANTTATPTNEAHRIWLNLTGTGAEYSQAVVGYFTNATSEADVYDSKYFNDGAVALNMVIGSTEYVIQGRPTPFQATDVVPMNYKVTTAGNYTFAIDHVDGLFTAGAQAIYIKDNQDGSYHNLSTPYTFTSAAGTFANRFELVYQTALGIDSPMLTANNVIVYNNNNALTINTGIFDMASVKVFDIRGRLLAEKSAINATQTTLSVSETNQILLVQVTSNKGIVVTKKVVN